MTALNAVILVLLSIIFI